MSNLCTLRALQPFLHRDVRVGDGRIGISTSGNSDILITSFGRAKQMGIITIGLSGGEGGKMKTSRIVGYRPVVSRTSIDRIRECRVFAYKILWDLVHTLFSGHRRWVAATGVAP
jgi:D-sedoheptulose 7-phosphate isomerase